MDGLNLSSATLAGRECFEICKQRRKFDWFGINAVAVCGVCLGTVSRHGMRLRAHWPTRRYAVRGARRPLHQLAGGEIIIDDQYIRRLGIFGGQYRELTGNWERSRPVKTFQNLIRLVECLGQCLVVGIAKLFKQQHQRRLAALVIAA